jgi:hypothetical protein
MQFIDDVSLPGLGKISGAFWSHDYQLLAVTSDFQRLTEPPARATYGGHLFEHRVSLYRPPSRHPIAVFDKAVLPIRDISFHPTKTVMAVGAGSYDGGYSFEGQLVIWDWAQGWSKNLRKIPETVRLEFTDTGDDLVALVRPWAEDLGEGQLRDSFNEYYRLHLKGILSREWGTAIEEDVRLQIGNARPLTKADFAASRQPIADPIEEVRRAFGLARLKQRSPIWDVAMLDSSSIGFVHEECLLEVSDLQGQIRQSFRGNGYGVQVFGTRKPLVYVVRVDEHEKDFWTRQNASLMQLDDGELRDAASLPGRYTFSVSHDETVLGRRDRSFQRQRTSDSVDVILNLKSSEVSKYDLGHYDVFNHFLRVDKAPYTFFVQGTPPSSHENKYLCTISSDGRVERLWPLLERRGGHASHAMECCFCYIEDSKGSGMIVSGKHYDPGARSYRGFLYRKNLDGRELWRHPTTAGASSIKFLSGSGLVIAALLDGEVWVMRGIDGTIVSRDPFMPGGIASIIYSLDVDGSRIAFGTIDGRCGWMPLSHSQNS